MPTNLLDPFDVFTQPLPFASGDNVYVITPSDTTDLPIAIRAMRVTTAGNYKVTCRDGSTPTMAFLAGETRYVRIRRVWSTGSDHTSGIEGHI